MRESTAAAIHTPAPSGSEPASSPSTSMREHLLHALRVTAVTLALTGLLYPLVITGLAKLLFPRQAEGSLVTDGAGRVVGSEIIAQPFTGAAYFQPRPSAAGENGGGGLCPPTGAGDAGACKGYDATSSGGSNLGPTSKKLREQAAAQADKLAKENPQAPGPVPVELVTASASGLDPHLSPAAALWQAPRVAQARGVAFDRVRAMVEEMSEGRDFGFLGEPRVNVLMLNLALDRRFGAPTSGGSASATKQ